MPIKTDAVKIKVYRAQLDFVNERGALFLGFVGGRGSGKSTALAMRLYKWALLEPGPYGMYAPTFPLLSDTIQRVFLTLAKPHIRDFNQTKNVIKMYGGAEIICRSLDDPEHARGPSLRGAVWDEASLCGKAAFDILIACLRYQGRQGWLACGFTPKGPSHWTAEVFNNPNWPDAKCFHSRTEDNPFNPPEFAERLRRQYTSAYAAQEVDGQFVTLGGTLMRREWFRIIEADAVPVLRGMARYWDLASTPANGVNNPDWTVGVKMGLTQDGRWIILDVRRAQLSPAGVEVLIASTAEEDGPQVRIGIEEEGGASGKSLIDHYRRNVLVGRAFRGYRSTGDKFVRAMPFAAAAEAGNILLLRGGWNKTFLDEIETFGSADAHDDQVDAASGAMEMLRTIVIRPHIGCAGNEKLAQDSMWIPMGGET